MVSPLFASYVANLGRPFATILLQSTIFVSFLWLGWLVCDFMCQVSFRF